MNNSSYLVFSEFDYIIFFLILSVSILIGIYFGCFVKKSNTTEEYLLGQRQMKTVPIAISLVASQISGIAIIALPAEVYSYSMQIIVIAPAMIIVTTVCCFLVVPVLYNNKISNCYIYLEMRFDKRMRQMVTALFIMNVYFLLPVIIFIPALAFSQVSGFNVHLINIAICGVCVFYTMLGGIKAVVWTDVVQAFVMLGSCIVIAYLGIKKVGGFQEIIYRAKEGGRLDIFNMKFDSTTRTTFWNTIFGAAVTWLGYVGFNQTCVQRLVALPSLGHARRSLIIFCIGYFIIMSLNCFTGVIMYARYYFCDPIKVGLVDKPDKLMPFFVQDVAGYLKGVPGFFVSCVFSAALSTMSANLNSISGVIYFDYICPFIRHTEDRANFIMKTIVALTGIFCIIGGVVVEKFSSIIQVIITITGVTQGSAVGIFLLGMLYPRANARAAFYSTLVSIFTMCWIFTGAVMAINNGEITYTPLPTKVDNCTNYNITNSNILTSFDESFNNKENDTFWLYKISFNWYSVIGALVVWITGIPLSYLFKNDKEKIVDKNLFSPVVQYFLLKKTSSKADVKRSIELKPLNTK